MKPTPIFVTGTGRSGTWILYKALGCHRDVHIFPKEMRFIIDPGGLRDLCYALSDGYHPVSGSEALYRFEQLMMIYLAEPDRQPYRGFNLPAWIGSEYYYHRIREFIEQVSDHEFKGRAWHVEPQHEGRLVEVAREVQALRYTFQNDRFLPYRISLPRDTSRVARYFSQSQDLIDISAALINDLFCHAAQRNGKQTWAEKTPQHLLCLNFLWELFPNCTVVHIKRDPRGVVHSLTKQPWAPSDVRGAALWLRNVYQRWFDLRDTLSLENQRYIEIKLEDLAISPHKYLSQVAALSGLTDEFENLPKISIKRVEYWQETMPAEDQQIVVDTLGSYFDAMGYEV